MVAQNRGEGGATSRSSPASKRPPSPPGPSRTPAKLCLSGSDLGKATVREKCAFTIEAVDAATGKRMSRGGEPFFVSIRGVANVRARIVDHDNGTYSVSWQPPQSGKYSVLVSQFGVPIQGCPFAVEAAPPEPSPLHSTVRGEALTTAHSQQTHTFDVSFRDQLGAVTQAVDLDVFIEPAPLASPRARGSTASPTLAASLKREETGGLRDADATEGPEDSFRSKEMTDVMESLYGSRRVRRESKEEASPPAPAPAPASSGSPFLSSALNTMESVTGLDLDGDGKVAGRAPASPPASAPAPAAAAGGKKGTAAAGSAGGGRRRRQAEARRGGTIAALGTAASPPDPWTLGGRV